MALYLIAFLRPRGNVVTDTKPRPFMMIALTKSRTLSHPTSLGNKLPEQAFRWAQQGKLPVLFVGVTSVKHEKNVGKDCLRILTIPKMR